MSLHDDIIHYGIKRRSGRYPWGSGQNPYQSERDKKHYVSDKRRRVINKKQITEVEEVAKSLSIADRALSGATNLRYYDKHNMLRYIDVSHDGNKPTGFSFFAFKDGEDLASIRVAVLPEYRNKGTAKKLISNALEYMDQEYVTKKAALIVDKNDKTMISVAKSLGFSSPKTVKPSGDSDYEQLLFSEFPNELLKKKLKHNDDIIHYGIKRRSGRYPWGSGEHPYQSEKSPPHQSERRSKKEKTPKDPVKMKRAEMIKSKNLHAMSPDDLQQMITRLKQEKELKNLVEADIAPGKKVIKEVMAEVGKKTVKDVISGSIKYAINFSLQEGDDRKFSTADLAKAIYPDLNKKKKGNKDDD